MKQVLIDSNFILTCLKQKIDFFEDLSFIGFELLIPKQVIEEISKIAMDKGKRKKLRHRDDAKLALKLIEKSKMKKIDIGKGYVDKQIKKYALKNPKVLIATLDKELANSLPNQKITIREKKRLEVI